MGRQIKGILFDLGDTLLDFGKVNASRLFKVGGQLAYDYLRQLGQPLPRFGSYVRRQHWAIRWNYVKGRLTGREFNSMDLLGGISRQFGQRLDDEQLLELAWLWYKPLRDVATVEEGLPEMLAELGRAGLTLGVVSNTFVPGAVLDRHLDQEGLLDSLPVRVYSCEVGFRKPRREIFAAALRRAGLDAPATLFVGDSSRADVEGANRMGMISVQKDPGDRHRSGRIRPNHRIRSILEVQQIVDSYGQPG